MECHTLIGVANVFLECLLHDVNHEYAAPIISQQGEVRDEIHAGLSIMVVTLTPATDEYVWWDLALMLWVNLPSVDTMH